jgi:hypothetical protein
MAIAPNGWIYVLEQNGQINAINPSGSHARTQIHDIPGPDSGSTTLSRDTGACCYERGAIGIEVDPNFLTNDKLNKGPRAFFSIREANPDNFDHLRGTISNGNLRLAWEDGTFGGDRDFNDAVLYAAFNTSPRFVQPVMTNVPAQTFVPDITLSCVFLVPPGVAPAIAQFVLESTDAKYRNEFGIYQVTDASGRIGAILPGQPGYARAALESAAILVGRNQRAGAERTLVLEPGAFYAFYIVQSFNLQVTP